MQNQLACSAQLGSTARLLSGTAAATLLLAYATHYKREGKITNALFLTHWNYVGVTVVLTMATFCSGSAVLAAAAAASVVSLFVVAARLLFLRVKSTRFQAMAWDVHTHIAVPFIPLALVAYLSASQCPNMSLACTSAGAAFAVMLVWAGINIYAQRVHPDKKWVYGDAANPRTAAGRKHILYSLGLTGACAGIVVAVSQCHRF